MGHLKTAFHCCINAIIVTGGNMYSFQYISHKEFKEIEEFLKLFNSVLYQKHISIFDQESKIYKFIDLHVQNILELDKEIDEDIITNLHYIYHYLFAVYQKAKQCKQEAFCHKTYKVVLTKTICGITFLK